MKLLAFEQRWATAVLEGFAPPRAVRDASELAPMPGEVDYLRAAEVLLTHVNTKAAVGMRLALWMVALSPVWTRSLGSRDELATFAELDAPTRAKLLERLLTHRSFAVRELTLFLKLVSCMAIFGVPAVRERAHYDPATAADDAGYEDVERSGERPRIRLELLGSARAVKESA